MRPLLIALLALFAITLAKPAYAHHRHYHHGKHHYHLARHGSLYVCGGCVVRNTLAGIVAVSAQNANRIVGTINALYEAGFRGRVKCAASGGHVPGSLHYTGNACDMAQRGWGRTVTMMYHARSIIVAHGMRDGCSFMDCGHIDMGFASARRHYHVRYAHHHHRAHYASG